MDHALKLGQVVKNNVVIWQSIEVLTHEECKPHSDCLLAGSPDAAQTQVVGASLQLCTE